jgi:hypothetical protein
MSIATDATDTAKALVTASLVGDFRACKTLVPEDPEEAAYLMIALSKLSAQTITSLAEERGEEPLVMWRNAMLTAAGNPC